jgi:type II secretory pathway pseudopilin PulG
MLRAEKGISIIELLVVIAIIVIALVSLLSTTAFSLKTSRLMKENDQAKELAQEALEAARSFRDGTTWNSDGLGTKTLDVPYHPDNTGGNWTLVLGEEVIDGFTRKVVFKRVFRDTNDNIAPAGVEDPNTKEVTATVSWKDKKVEISTYLTNWR